MAAAFPLEEAERYRRAVSVLLRDAADARDDPAKFFEFTMKHEVERTPLQTQPHQRLFFDFVMDHPMCVVILPIGTSKTFTLSTLGLHFLGQDNTFRGAFISATQTQAAKPLGMVKDYIEQSPELKMVFPGLRPSPRRSDDWTNIAITVDRPPGIRDPSFAAYGLEAASLPGARLKWILVDDILNHENTATLEQREKVFSWFMSTAFSRLDPRGGRCVVSNTAWHPDDLLHRLIKSGWPAIRMEVEGDVEIYNSDDWDRDYLRPKSAGTNLVRIVYPGEAANDNTTPLWRGRYDEAQIAKLRRDNPPTKFNQLYRGLCRDDATAACQEEWIERCKKRARDMGHHEFVSRYDGPNLTFTGVDLAVGENEEHDDTCFFTIEVLPNGLRKILEIDRGQYNGPTIVKKILEKSRNYNSIVRVENNACQEFIRHFALDADASVPVKAHTTGRAKAHPEHGIPGVFIEIYNGAWLIPNDRHGRVHPQVQKWIDGCLYYKPSKHTDDALMAMYFARDQAREFGVLSGSDTSAVNDQGGIGAALLAR